MRTANWCAKRLPTWCRHAGRNAAAPSALPIGTRPLAGYSTSLSRRAAEGAQMRRPAWLLEFTRHVRLQNAMIVLCTILVSAYGASMYGSLHRAYRQTLDDATGNLQSIARSSEVGTNRSIFEIDAMLLG